MHQSPRQRNALLLAAGKLLRQAVRLAREPHQVQHIGHAPLDLPLGDIRHTHGKGHVLVGRHRGNKAEILEHHAQPAAQVGISR